MSADAREWVSDADVAAFQRDGVLCLRGVFADWVAPLIRGVARNQREPGPYGGDSVADGDTGRFFDDYCNWRRIPEYRDFVMDSPAAAIAARVMRSERVQIYHEHVLVKEPGTGKATPWHHDLTYYNVEGEQTVSLWLALDAVARETAPEFIAGSHRWGKRFYPRLFKDSSDYGYAGDGYESVPDIDADRNAYDVVSWALAPGDAVLFSFLTLHGAPPNLSATRRRGFSTRWLGDDARFAKRPGRTSPPYAGIGLDPGEAMREDWFPVVWPR